MLGALAGVIKVMGLGDAVAQHFVEAQASYAEEKKMLGDAMMRAGAMETAMEARQRLPAMSINKYNTPTVNNQTAPFSVGIMNLTEPEVEAIIQFARDIDRMRSTSAMLSQPDPRGRRPDVASSSEIEYAKRMIAERKERNVLWGPTGNMVTRAEAEVMMTKSGYDAGKRAALLQAIVNDKDDERRKFLTDMLTPPIEEKSEPEAPRNRFSGLDIE